MFGELTRETGESPKEELIGKSGKYGRISTISGRRSYDFDVKGHKSELGLEVMKRVKLGRGSLDRLD